MMRCVYYHNIKGTVSDFQFGENKYFLEVSYLSVVTKLINLHSGFNDRMECMFKVHCVW